MWITLTFFLVTAPIKHCFDYVSACSVPVCRQGVGKPRSRDMALKLFAELINMSARGDLDELSATRVLAILDGLKAASTQGAGECLKDILPSAFKALRVFRTHRKRHIAESATLVQRRWATVLVPSCSSLPPPAKRRRCDMSDGQIPHKDFFAAMTVSSCQLPGVRLQVTRELADPFFYH